MLTIFLYTESKSINSLGTHFSTQAFVYAMKSSSNTVFQFIQGLRITTVYYLFCAFPKKQSQGIKSSDFGGQFKRLPRRPIQGLEKLLFK